MVQLCDPALESKAVCVTECDTEEIMCVCVCVSVHESHMCKHILAGKEGKEWKGAGYA